MSQGDKIEGVAPTRMKLLELRERTELASHGYDLLKEKRDALIIEFYNVLEEIQDVRSEAEERLEIAHEQLEIAGLKLGMAKLHEIGLAAPEIMTLKASTRNIMGVRTPKLSLQKREVKKPFYNSEFTSISLDDTISAFREYLYNVINLAEKIATLQKLAYEISNTNRRVNALDHIVIPRLKNTANFIELALEEEAREEFSRLKFMKNKLMEEEERKMKEEQNMEANQNE